MKFRKDHPAANRGVLKSGCRSSLYNCVNAAVCTCAACIQCATVLYRATGGGGGGGGQRPFVLSRMIFRNFTGHDCSIILYRYFVFYAIHVTNRNWAI